MPKTSLTLEQVLTLLAATPPRIATLTVGMTENELHTGPKDGEWSVNDVLAHMRSCADVWGNCIATMLTEDKPTLRAIDPRTWIKSTDYPELEFGPSLHSYTKQRTELLAVLEALPPEAWSREATVTGAGSPLQRSVFAYARRLARHERPHVKQIERIAASMKEHE